MDAGHLNFRLVCCLTCSGRNQTSELSYLWWEKPDQRVLQRVPGNSVDIFYDFPYGVVNLHVPVNLSQKGIQYKFDHRTVEVRDEF